MTDTDELRRLLDEAIEEHAPWSMTEYGQLCQCGEPMRDEICLGMGRTEKGRKLTAATFAALPGLLDERDELRAEVERLRELGTIAQQVHQAELVTSESQMLRECRARAEAAEAKIAAVEALAREWIASGTVSVYESAQELGWLILDALAAGSSVEGHHG